MMGSAPGQHHPLRANCGGTAAWLPSTLSPLPSPHLVADGLGAVSRLGVAPMSNPT